MLRTHQDPALRSACFQSRRLPRCLAGPGGEGSLFHRGGCRWPPPPPSSCSSRGCSDACWPPPTPRWHGAVAGPGLCLTPSAWQGSGGRCAELPEIAPGSPPTMGEPDCARWAAASRMTQFPAPQPPPLLTLPSSSSAPSHPSRGPQVPPECARRLPTSGCPLGRARRSPGPRIQGPPSRPVTDLPMTLAKAQFFSWLQFSSRRRGRARLPMSSRYSGDSGATQAVGRLVAISLSRLSYPDCSECEGAAGPDAR